MSQYNMSLMVEVCCAVIGCVTDGITNFIIFMQYGTFKKAPSPLPLLMLFEIQLKRPLSPHLASCCVCPALLHLRCPDVVTWQSGQCDGDWLDLLCSYRAVYIHCPRDPSRSSFWTSVGGARQGTQDQNCLNCFMVF